MKVFVKFLEKRGTHAEKTMLADNEESILKLLTSPDEERRAMNFDDILKEVGQFGRYQIVLYALLSLPGIFSTYFSVSYTFTAAAEVQYRCHIPECESAEVHDFTPKWLNYTIPIVNGQPAQCFKFTSLSFDKCTEDNFNANSTEKCNTFVIGPQKSTAVHDFGYFCDEALWRKSLVGVVNCVGQLFGVAPLGLLSDRYGRKRGIVLGTLLSTIMGLARAMAPNFPTFVIFEFLDGFVSSAVYSSIFVLGVEMVGPEKREMGGIVLSCLYSSGIIVMGLIAKYTQNWRQFLWVLYLPGLLFVSYIWILPESVRWLITRKRFNDACNDIEVMYKVNKSQMSEETKRKLTALRLGDTGTREEEVTLSVTDIVKTVLASKKTLLRLSVVSFVWFGMALAYYGLTLMSVAIQGDSYTNFMLMGLVEFPATLLAWFLMEISGRKWSQFGTLFLAGLVLIGCHFAEQDIWLLLLLLLGKALLTAAFVILYVYASEVFPTTVRNFALSTCSIAGRIGNIGAPSMPLLSHLVDPILVFGIITLVAGVSIVFLPETRSLSLPDTIHDAEQIGKTTEKSQADKS